MPRQAQNKEAETNVTTEDSNVTKTESTPQVKNNPSAPKEDTITVSREQLDSILQKIAEQDATITELKQTQKEYEQTASQDQIRKIEQLRASGKLVKSVKVNMHDGKYVTGWRSTVDDVWVDSNSKEHRLQKTEVTYADGSKQELDQLEFARRKTYKEMEVIKEAKNQEGNIVLTVQDTDGKEIDIDSRFIN